MILVREKKAFGFSTEDTRGRMSKILLMRGSSQHKITRLPLKNVHTL